MNDDLDDLRESLIFLIQNPVSGDDDKIADSYIEAVQEIYRLVPKSPHGTENRYNNYGCRCAACRTAHADYRRKPPMPRFYKEPSV